MISGKEIIILGGEVDNLNPAIIHLNEDGSTGFERCQNGKHEKRHAAVGDFLDGKFVICGGGHSNKCQAIDESNSYAFQMEANGRTYASHIKLNKSTIWITGGRDVNGHAISSTEFVNINGSSSGINLPFTVFGHCMVEYKGQAILISGKQDGIDKSSNNTWIIDLNNGFKVTEGPPLKNGRRHHSCGKIRDKYGNILLIIAGGENKKSVEVLNTSVMKEWIESKRLFQKAMYFIFNNDCNNYSTKSTT